jgi:hypothetical protein
VPRAFCRNEACLGGVARGAIAAEQIYFPGRLNFTARGIEQGAIQLIASARRLTHGVERRAETCDSRQSVCTRLLDTGLRARDRCTRVLRGRDELSQ